MPASFVQYIDTICAVHKWKQSGYQQQLHVANSISVTNVDPHMPSRDPECGTPYRDFPLRSSWEGVALCSKRKSARVARVERDDFISAPLFSVYASRSVSPCQSQSRNHELFDHEVEYNN